MSIPSSFNLFSILLILSSCSPILGIYGVHNPKEINEQKITQYSERHGMPNADLFELDSSYFSYLAAIELNSKDPLMTDSLKRKELKNQVKNHYQPLQALYFNKKGELESFQINCYAGGFPNLNWDRDSILTTFPPKFQAPLDSILSESKLISFLHTLGNSAEIKLGAHDYIVYVFWNKFMGRQNKRFINFLQENSKLSKENIRVVYINMDNAFKKSGIW